MDILITGGTGFIGSALTAKWLAEGHHLTILTRQSLPIQNNIRYVRSLQHIDNDTTFDGAVNLAGYSLFQRPWLKSIKKKIESSRLEITDALYELNQRLNTPIPVLISGSAVGYYGNQLHHWVSETSTAGHHFGAHLCQQWEQKAQQLEEQGTRVCLIRTGIVLGKGGALVPMQMAARFGVLNVMGSGEQYWPWIDLDDEVNAIDFLLQHPQLSGPFNLCSPNPVTNREFTEALASAMKRKVRLPAVPGFALKAMTLGAGELLLDSQRVTPSQLLGAGFEFKYQNLEDSLKRYC